jgi:uncharacterized protein (UPF0262 family)
MKKKERMTRKDGCHRKGLSPNVFQHLSSSFVLTVDQLSAGKLFTLRCVLHRRLCVC